MFMGQTSLEQSGNVRSEGPKPPMIATPDNHPMNIDRQQSAFVPYLQQLIAETGWKGGAPTNFWIVGYKAQPVAIKEDAKSQAIGDWSKAAPLLRAAIECREPLPSIKSLQSVLRQTNGSLTGDHVFPEPLTVFGTIKVKAVTIFQGTEDEGSSFTVKPDGLTVAEIAKAARLKKDSGRYVRMVKGGMIELNETRPGEINLNCVRGGASD